MNNQYLPSKKYVMKLVAIAIIIVVSIGIYGLYNYISKKVVEKNAPKRLLVKNLVEKDSNSNGIPDWEENLWGLDPTQNGPQNKEFILANRQALAKGSEVPTNDNGSPVNSNDALSRQFFAVIMSLEQSGNLDDASLKAISDAMGERIVATPINDVYTKESAIVKNTDAQSIKKYYIEFGKLLDKYKNKNIGDELSFIATAVKNNDAGALVAVRKISDSYRSFGKDLMKIETPSVLLVNHVQMANNYDKVATSIEDLTKLGTDPTKGMQGIINYKKYSDALIQNMQKLSDNLQ